MFEVLLDTESLANDTEALLDRLERATYRGLDRVAQLHADAARTSHWYRNRTGDLERSTQPVEAEGSVWDDGASSSVVASMDYASYVDTHGPILAPAWDAIESTATSALNTILEDASG